MNQKDNPPEPSPLEKEYESDKEAFKEKYGVEPGSPPPDTQDPHKN